MKLLINCHVNFENCNGYSLTARVVRFNMVLYSKGSSRRVSIKVKYGDRAACPERALSPRIQSASKGGNRNNFDSFSLSLSRLSRSSLAITTNESAENKNSPTMRPRGSSGIESGAVGSQAG